MSMLTYKYFSSSGTWTCPAGVTRIWVLAQGGGAGGNGGRNTTGQNSILSAGTSPYLVQLNVTPNTTYSITIGSGGAGGGNRTSGVANASPGGNTTFGALYSWYGGYIDCGYYGETSGPSGLLFYIEVGNKSNIRDFSYQIVNVFFLISCFCGTKTII